MEQSGEWQKLSSEEKRYANQNIKNLERGGLKLNTGFRAQFTKLSEEMDNLSQKADQNIAEDSTSIDLSLDELKGVPKKRLDKFQKVDGKPGYYKVKLDKVTLSAIFDKL